MDFVPLPFGQRPNSIVDYRLWPNGICVVPVRGHCRPGALPLAMLIMAVGQFVGFANWVINWPNGFVKLANRIRQSSNGVDPLFFANGDIHHSQGHRPWTGDSRGCRLANGHIQMLIMALGQMGWVGLGGRVPGALPLAMLSMAVGQMRLPHRAWGSSAADRDSTRTAVAAIQSHAVSLR